MAKRRRKYRYTTPPTTRQRLLLKKQASEGKVKEAFTKYWYEKSEDKIFIGAHFSIDDEGGIPGTIEKAKRARAKSLALFLSNNRSYSKTILDHCVVEEFLKLKKKHGFPSHLITVHASHLINLASEDKEKRKLSERLMLFDAINCDHLQIGNLVIHAGTRSDEKCGVMPEEVAIERVVNSIDRVLSESTTVHILIENTAGDGNKIGNDLATIGKILAKVQANERVGLCLDTCHAFAAGYDLNYTDGITRLLEDVDTKVGRQYLKAIHLNGSKFPPNSKRDVHAPFGEGCISDCAFKWFLREEHCKNIPIILETFGCQKISQVDFYRSQIERVNTLKRLKDDTTKMLDQRVRTLLSYKSKPLQRPVQQKVLTECFGRRRSITKFLTNRFVFQ